MSKRNLSPTEWNAAAKARLSIKLTWVVDNTPVEEPLDTWESDYAVRKLETVTLSTAASGVNTITVPSTNCRFLIVIPPENNATAITAHGQTIGSGTGFPLNPNGFLVVPFPATGAPTSINLVNGGSASIEGVRLLWI